MEEYSRLLARIAPSINNGLLELIMSQPLSGTKMDIPHNGRAVEVWFHSAVSPDAPVLFEMHGGGFVFGHAAKTDGFCQKICADGDINVIGINYRKTPQHVYPAALEDVIGVIEWFWEHAGTLGINRQGFFVCGESAGANLAAAVANRLMTDGRIQIRGQILHYPFLDMTAVFTPQYPTDLPEEVVRAFIELYCGDMPHSDPSISPVCTEVESLSGTAPALIMTAEFDTLKTSGHIYAELLRASGTDVREFEMRGAHHGYIEDWFNPACYGLVQEQEKIHHSPNFGELAERAAQETISFVRDNLK